MFRLIIINDVPNCFIFAYEQKKCPNIISKLNILINYSTFQMNYLNDNEYNHFNV